MCKTEKFSHGPAAIKNAPYGCVQQVPEAVSDAVLPDTGQAGFILNDVNKTVRKSPARLQGYRHYDGHRIPGGSQKSPISAIMEASKDRGQRHGFKIYRGKMEQS